MKWVLLLLLYVASDHSHTPFPTGTWMAPKSNFSQQGRKTTMGYDIGRTDSPECFLIDYDLMYTSIFFPSIQSCPILRDCLDKSLQGCCWVFSEVVWLCFLPRAERKLLAEGHPASFVSKAELELMVSWFQARCLKHYFKLAVIHLIYNRNYIGWQMINIPSSRSSFPSMIHGRVILFWRCGTTIFQRCLVLTTFNIFPVTQNDGC